MATSKSKLSALAAASAGIVRTVTEFTLMCGKQGVFTNTDFELVQQQKRNAMLADMQSAVQREYTINKRDVVYEGDGEIETGEAALGLKAAITETDVTEFKNAAEIGVVQ